MKTIHGKPYWLGCVAVFLTLSSITNAVGAATPALKPIPEFSLDRFEPGVRNAIADSLNQIQQNRSSSADKLAQSYGSLGMLLHAHDLVDLAEPCYINAQTLAPEQYKWPYLLAYLYQVDSRLEAAEKWYRHTLQLKPGFLPALLHLGQTLSELQKDQQAQGVFGAALEIDPGNAVALAGMGNIAYRRGDYDKTIELLNRALASDPQATRLNHMLGMAYRKLGDISKAREYLERRGTRNPAITDPVLAGVQALLSNSQDHIKKGLDAYNAGKFKEASREYRQAVKSAPSDMDTRLALAWVLELEGADEDALAEVEHVLDANPQFAKGHYLKGALLAKSDLNREALTHLRQAVTLEPNAATPRLLLATTLMRSGNYSEAEVHYAQLAAGQNNDAILLYRLGMARLAANNCSQAIAPLESALRIRSNSLTVTHALLRAYSICPVESEGHKRTALVQAQRIFDQIQRWDSAETLAMALAANSRYREAAQLQQTVLDEARKAGESGTILEALSRNLQRYLSKQPADKAWPTSAEVFRPPALTAEDRLRLDG